MDHAALISDPAGLAAGFIAEWFDSCPTVTAHTSGSTGTPKEIRLPKADMRVSAGATCRALGIGPGSTLVLPLSADYIAGKMMIVRALTAGCRLHIEKPSSAPLHTPYDTVDLTAIVPSQIDGLLASPCLASIRQVIVGGAPMTPEQERRLRTVATLHAYATYGMTETCSHVALRDISSGEDTFRALPGITFSLDDRGCLVIEAPAYSFGRLVTNDVATLLSPQEFRWLGRADNVIISGGVKLHPELIERRIAPAIPQPFYIAGAPDPRLGQCAVLYVEAPDADTEALRAAIAPLLADIRYGMPRRIVAVSRFRRTSSGKIIRTLP